MTKKHRKKKPRKTTGKKWMIGRIARRIRMIELMEARINRFEKHKRNRPKVRRSYDKRVSEVMGALLTIMGKVKIALRDCVPSEINLKSTYGVNLDNLALLPSENIHFNLTAETPLLAQNPADGSSTPTQL